MLFHCLWLLFFNIMLVKFVHILAVVMVPSHDWVEFYGMTAPSFIYPFCC